MPPCDTCDRPDLDSSNTTAWELWVRLSKLDRPVGFAGFLPLPTLKMAEFCEMYDATLEDLEKMVLIEEILFPTINKKEGE